MNFSEHKINSCMDTVLGYQKYAEDRIKRLQDQVRALQEKENHNIMFSLTEEEQALAAHHIAEHNTIHMGDSFDKYSYCFTPNVLGNIITLRCKCGKEFILSKRKSEE